MNSEQRLSLIRGVRRVVIKIGSGVLSKPEDGGLCPDTMKRLVADICAIESAGRYQVVLVSSGAVMGGRRALDLPAGRLSIPMKQAAAAVGQVKLMNLYKEYFSQNGRKVAQILLTHGDIEDETRKHNVANTITELLRMNVLPIINENDSTAVDELKFGDNDTLAAKITSVVEADLLLVLSDVDGLYDSDPRTNREAKLIGDVKEIETVRHVAGDSSSGAGTGGMKAKVNAARIAADFGIPMWIVGGKTEGAIADALHSGNGGTFFHPAGKGMSPKKHWLKHLTKPRGKLVVDAGARKALVEGKKSLLAKGIVSVKGKFESGNIVSVLDAEGAEIARGEVNYGHHDLLKIHGKESSEFDAILGYKSADEVIHRDKMIVTVQARGVSFDAAGDLAH